MRTTAVTVAVYRLRNTCFRAEHYGVVTLCDSLVTLDNADSIAAM